MFLLWGSALHAHTQKKGSCCLSSKPLTQSCQGCSLLLLLVAAHSIPLWFWGGMRTVCIGFGTGVVCTAGCGLNIDGLGVVEVCYLMSVWTVSIPLQIIISQYNEHCHVLNFH